MQPLLGVTERHLGNGKRLNASNWTAFLAEVTRRRLPTSTCGGLLARTLLAQTKLFNFGAKPLNFNQGG
jgi:hypothetical protein